MESSYEYFKRIGMKEVPFKELPKNYAWVTGCGNGKGSYYNFFMPMNHTGTTESDYQKFGLMCKIS